MKIFKILAASAVAFTSVCLPLATTANAKSCDDINFIFARGSGQNLSAAEYRDFKDNILSTMNSSGLNLKINFYELGSDTYGGARYPAIDVGGLTALGAKVSAGRSFAFGKSVEQGETELKSYIAEVMSTCKNTKFVLGGYSQGAMVITNSIPYLDPNRIIYAATFGDPYLYLPEGKGIIPDACRGKNFSDYREFAPNCRTHEGILGAKDPYEPSDFLGKIGLWCNDHDFMCGAGFKTAINLNEGDIASQIINNALKAGHLNYVSDGHFESAANIIANKIRQSFPKLANSQSTSTNITPVSNRDTVILIDRTNSMRTHINSYKNEAKRLAKETLDSGGRIALYTFGDLDDNKNLYRDDLNTPEKLVDFGASYEEFCTALDNIKLIGGGDNPESALSGLLGIMNEQKWKVGATKSIILLTDAEYLMPDRDGTTLKQVINRSLEIDPVNIYVINTTDSAPFYTSLTEATGGQIFTDASAISSDYILNRPAVNFPLANYLGLVGEELEFDATTTEDIVKYEWDLDFDGTFETITTIPKIVAKYTAPTSGFLQLRITDTNGLSSTASAAVSIYNNLENIPEIANANYSLDGYTAHLSFNTKNTIATLISINGDTLGITTKTEIDITDLEDNTSISLTPIGTDGFTGNAVLINIPIVGLGGESNEKTAPDILKANNPISNSASVTEPDTKIKILPPNAGKL
ncbi:cutinase family protein [Candidatus Saccharibacteria bacterium]|nr:cutinase family protein [Candidatus Saccharibacteria bacterium]